MKKFALLSSSLFLPLFTNAQLVTIKTQPDSVYMVTNYMYSQIDRRFFFEYPTFQNSNSELGYTYTIINGSKASIGVNGGSAYRYFNLVSTTAGTTSVELGIKDPANVQSNRIKFNITVLPRAIDTLKSNQNKSYYTRGFPADKWTLLSLPINDLQLTPSIIFKQFEGDFKIYSVNESGKAVDVSKQDSLFFNLGSGYWFKTKATSEKWNLSIPFQSVRRTDALKRFYLKKGWKLIGSPYDYPVYWRSFLFENGLQADNDVVRLWSFNPETGTWREIDKYEFIYPWTAYAVYNPIETTGEVAIDFYHSYGLNYYFTVPPKKERVNEILAKAALQINDQELNLGYSTLATDGIDATDEPLRPLSPESTNIPAFFMNEGMALLDDYRSASATVSSHSSEVWNLQLPKGEHTILLKEMAGFEPNSSVLISGASLYRFVQMGESIKIQLKEDSQLHVKVGLVEDLKSDLLPESPTLFGNFPNPFNPITNISFSLPKASNVQIKLFNQSGMLIQTIKQGAFQAGYHQVPFNASHLASGIYFYKIDIEKEASLTGKLTLIK